MSDPRERARLLDPASVAGAPPTPETHSPLVVVGAGPAGLAAALTAARAGVPTMLVDEHPVASGLMGLDVPFHFGQRMDAAVQNKARMIERLVETNPDLGEAFELGIDIRLGVYVAGAFAKGPTIRSLSRPMLMLADDERSWTVGCDRLIVATGARDFSLSFAGWEKPGVMGAQGFAALSRRYRAFAGRRLLVLGSGALGLATALAALEDGYEVAGIVEVADAARGPAALRAALAERGVPVFDGHMVKEALGAAEVTGARLVRLDATGRPIQGSETTLSCDTIVTALGLVPNVELLDVLGCRLVFRSERGGYVPLLDEQGRASLPFVQVVGDAACVSSDRLCDPSIAAAEGRAAGARAAASLGKDAGEPADVPTGAAADFAAIHPYWQTWLDASMAVGGGDVHVCQCEEVTRRELLELRPPRYLGWGGSQMKARDVSGLAAEGPLNQDQVKRLTRAGMGPCQGRRCREQVQMLLAAAAGLQPGDIPLASYRAPVRPLPLGVLWPHDEPQAMRDNWVGWFDIPMQFSQAAPSDPVGADLAAPSRDSLRGLGHGAVEE